MHRIIVALSIFLCTQSERKRGSFKCTQSPPLIENDQVPFYRNFFSSLLTNFFSSVFLRFFSFFLHASEGNFRPDTRENDIERKKGIGEIALCKKALIGLREKESFFSFCTETTYIELTQNIHEIPYRQFRTNTFSS